MRCGMTNLIPITIDEIRQLKGRERAEALRRYAKWRDKERANDKREKKNLDSRIRYFQRNRKGGKNNTTKL